MALMISHHFILDNFYSKSTVTKPKCLHELLG